jgi:hypothetical protein
MLALRGIFPLEDYTSSDVRFVRKQADLINGQWRKACMCLGNTHFLTLLWDSCWYDCFWGLVSEVRLSHIRYVFPQLFPFDFQCRRRLVWYDIDSAVARRLISTSILSKNSVFLCFPSTWVKLMTSTQKKILRYVTIIRYRSKGRTGLRRLSYPAWQTMHPQGHSRLGKSCLQLELYCVNEAHNSLTLS